MALKQLVLVNNSKQPGNLIIYHKYEGPYTPVAWFSKYAYTGGHVKFSWNPWDFCFVWGATADIGPGTAFEAGQTVPANVNDARVVNFSYDSEHRTFYFTPLSPEESGHFRPFTVRQDGSIPPNAAAVGIGIAERVTCAVQASPNMWVEIDPRGTTWVTFGAPKQGELFDLNDVLEPVQIEFRPNIDSLTVTLNADNTWSVKENIMMLAEEEEREEG